jgi:hypothetical protein
VVFFAGVVFLAAFFLAIGTSRAADRASTRTVRLSRLLRVRQLRPERFALQEQLAGHDLRGLHTVLQLLAFLRQARDTLAEILAGLRRASTREKYLHFC